ncbi:plastocyanin [Paramagnetospirillum kuznetsovii]|uniref:Plastocyanin n=1 Tax=Paramagnetospirillum kuznetsovii TaxID=2053833 RepID=A0A364P235_9PROT|nr:plastocyanin/azurin family copper-binding protein [Paramagnetospirillum kuznetsovii]RAU23402.1 plastocyanin [Paramagnetospirillum kuznetsovii]
MARLGVCAAALLMILASPVWAGETVRVSIDKMMFTPKILKVKPGTTVEWVNDEKRNNHSVLFEKEGLPESDRLFPGDSWKRSFDKPGLYPYVCGPHRDMTGVIEVAP